MSAKSIAAENKRLKMALPVCTSVVDNLLHDIRCEIRDNIEIWHDGEGQFQHIKYCMFCHYSQAHGHGETCIISRLDSAIDGAETEGEPK